MATESDPDIETDACPEAEVQQHHNSEPKTEYFDGVLVYADDDYHIAVWILAFMTSIKLEEGTCPKIVLHEHPKLNVSKIEKSERVLTCCSLVFVVTTKQLSKDHYADYIKEETIADTRLNDDIPWYQRYRVIPLHTKAKGKRDYKIPVGLRAIEPFNVHNEKCKRSQDRLRQLFDEGYLLYRKSTKRPMHKQECQTPGENGDAQFGPLNNQPEQNIGAQNQGMENPNAEDTESREILYDRNQSPLQNADGQRGHNCITPNKQEDISNRSTDHSERSNVPGVSKDNRIQVHLDQEHNRFRLEEQAEANSSVRPDNASLAPQKESKATHDSRSENFVVSGEEAKEVPGTDHDYSDLQNMDLSMDEPGIKRDSIETRSGQNLLEEDLFGPLNSQPAQRTDLINKGMYQQTGGANHEHRKKECNKNQYPFENTTAPTDHSFSTPDASEESKTTKTDEDEELKLSNVSNNDLGKDSDDQSNTGSTREQEDCEETNLPRNTLATAKVSNKASHAEAEEGCADRKSTPELCEVIEEEAKGIINSNQSGLQDFDLSTDQEGAPVSKIEKSDQGPSGNERFQPIQIKQIVSENTKVDGNGGGSSKKGVEVENLKRVTEDTENIPLNTTDTMTQILPVSHLAESKASTLDAKHINCTGSNHSTFTSTGEHLNGDESADSIMEKETPLEQAAQTTATSRDNLTTSQSVTNDENHTTDPTDTKVSENRHGDSEQIKEKNGVQEIANVKEIAPLTYGIEAQRKPFAQRVVKEQPLRCSDPSYNAASIPTPGTNPGTDCSREISNNLNDIVQEKRDLPPEESTVCIKNRDSYRSQEGTRLLPVSPVRTSPISKTDSLQEKRKLTERETHQRKYPLEHDERESSCSQEETSRDESSSFTEEYEVLSADGPVKETKDKSETIANSSRVDFIKKKEIISFKPCSERNFINKLATGDPVDRHQFERKSFPRNESSCKSNLPHINTNAEKRKEANVICTEPRLIRTDSSAPDAICTRVIILGASNVMIGSGNNLFDNRDNAEQTQDKFPETPVSPNEELRLPLRHLSKDGVPSTPHLELLPFTGDPKEHLPKSSDDNCNLVPRITDGQEESDLSSFPCKELPSHNDLVADLSGNEEETEEDGFLAKFEEPADEDKGVRCRCVRCRCYFICCWKN